MGRYLTNTRQEVIRRQVIIGKRVLLIDSKPVRIPIPAIVVPAVVLLLYFFVPGVREQPWTAVRTAGAVLAITGYSMFVIARLQLGKSFAVTPQAKELVTIGLYSRIRNPIYAFVDVMIFGLILALHLPWLFALYPLLVAMHVVRAHKEAKVLREKFGEAYLDYCSQTWF
jgi:protein-S-isoprenylcysteine O-methyltransferase Ste14